MAIPPPVSLLWTDVEPLTEWPTTDEDLMREVARGWTDAGAAFLGASTGQDNLADGWNDPCGAMFREKLAKLRSFFLYDGEAMKHLAFLAAEYGNDVALAKTQINGFIDANEILYVYLKSFYGLIGDTGAVQDFINQVANSINVYLGEMAERIATRGRGAPDLAVPLLWTNGELLYPGEDGEVVPTPTENLPADYTWAQPNAPTDVLAPGDQWDPRDGTPVIGNLPDTMFAGQWPGNTYLDLEAWSLEKNDAYIQTIIDGRGSVYVATPLDDSGWETEAERPTVFAREIRQLLQAGYTWDGNVLQPPAR